MASSYVQPSTAFDVMRDSGASILNAKILKPLDEVLRCHICFDYFTNCMITKCSHNYCSVCIRRYMNYKSQCPTCFQVATEPELQNNRLIDEILRIYKKIRENVQISHDTTTIKSFPEQSSSSRVISDSSEKPTKGETSTNKASSQQNDISTSDEVSCPVCYRMVPNSRINIHLDSCLKQSEERNQRKSLPKLVYHLLSDKEIKKKLKEHDLNTSGNRQALIRRHKNFITLFNANCDALEPKPVSELILEIERQELEERLNAQQRSTQINKKSDPSLIEKEQESYVQEHKSQFNALIQDVQQRVLGERQIKQEVDATEVSSKITDNSGKVVGESTLRIGNAPDFEPVIVKEEPLESFAQDPEEFSESLLEDAYSRHNAEQIMTQNSAIGHNDLDTGMELMDTDFNKTAQLPFRIKKDMPSVKIKEEPQFLLDSTNKDLTKDSPSSLDDFETGKTQITKFHKKKYVRRLSTEEKNSQRKK